MSILHSLIGLIILGLCSTPAAAKNTTVAPTTSKAPPTTEGLTTSTASTTPKASTMGGSTTPTTGGSTAPTTGGTTASITEGPTASTTGGSTASTTGGSTASTTVESTGSTASTTGGSTTVVSTGSTALTTGGSTASTTGGSTASTTGGSTASKASTTGGSTAPTTGGSTTPMASTTGGTKVPSTGGSTTSTAPTTGGSTTSGTPTTTAATQMGKIFINEFTFTGLFSAGNQFFVELKRQDEVTENITVVVLDGVKNLSCQGIQRVDSTWEKHLHVVDVTLSEKADRQSVVVALYATDAWANCSDYDPNTPAHVLDVMVLSKSPDAVNITTVTERFKIVTKFKVLVADESNLKALKGKFSISRCGNISMNVGSFLVATETRNETNNCSMPENDAVNLSFNASSGVNCTSFKNKDNIEFLKTYIAKEVGDKCACGLSPYLISLGNFDCTGMMQKLFIKALTVAQGQHINSTFYSTLKENTCLKGGDSFCLTKPCHNCGHLPQPDKGKKGSINVTVAVVITCIVVFVVIVFVVIIYIRRKRRGILQFRMTRLNEDDDDLIGQDTDDFVGSQDASFSNSSYSRFQ